MKSELFHNEANSEIITADEFIDFINSFKKPIICQICGSQSWSVVGAFELDVEDNQPKHHVIETLSYAQYKPETDTAVTYPGGMPLFRITCDNCAHVLLFSYKKARTLIQKRKNEKIEDRK
ncbi:hypothetical protein [Enterobacter cloacae]|uniref:hypothetical protein n=1 Tax=Enterobacter cloacae TaxID=550 RepID=UPI0028748D28|nr:hypothetical protein [Enterobacter cloacae]ELT0931631.1 hypothetical protein [Enterobacter roggenkampii]MDS0028101.1 hypothetical protein [Enterobacter cloacae subsp. cloacae]